MGCGLSANNQVYSNSPKIDIPQGLVSGIKKNNQIIVALSDTSIDQKSNLMNSFQFFNLNARYLWKIANDNIFCSNTIDLVLTCMEDLLRVLPIYIRSNMDFTLYACQILSSYSMILFQFFATNGKRYLDVQKQGKYLNFVTVTEQQLKIERENDPLINVIECLLFQVKAAITLAPTDSKEGTAILKQFLGGALKAGLSFTLNDDLTESLLKGIIFIYKEYKKSQIKRKFELIYYITGLKYSILQEMEAQYDISKIIMRITLFYQKIIKNCVDWEIQCCWIQSLSQIINHKFTINESQILGNEIIDDQFIIKIKEQSFVSINSQDIQNNPNAKKLFSLMTQLQSFSNLQYELIKGNSELKGYEKIYKMKLELEKQESSMIIDKAILNNILLQIKDLQIRQNKISNEFNENINGLDQIVEYQIECLFTLQQTIQELSQSSLTLYGQNDHSTKAKDMPMTTDDQQIASIYYFRDVLKTKDENLLHTPFIENLNLVLNGNIKQNLDQIQIEEREAQLFELQRKLQIILDQYTQSTDSKLILSDLHYILEIISHYEGILKYNITQLQYLQIGYKKMDKFEFYDYEGLQKIIEQLHKILQIAEANDQFKLNQIQQSQKIKAQLNKVIVGKIEHYNFKVGNLSQIINEPNAIQQIQSISENILKDIDQLVAGLNMICSTMEYESDILHSNDQNSAKEAMLLEIIQAFKQGYLISPEQVISIQQKIQICAQQIRQDQIIQKKSDENVIDILLILEKLSEELNTIKNFQILNSNDEEFILYQQKEIIKDLEQFYQKQLDQLEVNLFDSQKEREVYEQILNRSRLMQNQQIENNKNISEYIKLSEQIKQSSQNLRIYQKYDDVRYLDNKQNTEKQIKQCQEKQNSIKMDLTLKIADLYDKINAPNQFINYPRELESQIIMILKSVSKKSDASQKQTLFDSIAEQIEDTLNGEQWRIRQIIIYELLQMESNLLLAQTLQINRGLLVKLQIYETDPRIKGLFENPQQLQLMKQYWPTVEEQVQMTIKEQLSSLNKLIMEISNEKNGQVKQRKQQQFNLLQKQINDQIQNVQSVSSSLGITVLFLQDLKSDLGNIQNTLNEIQQTVNSMGHDLKALRGRSFQELLELRMRNLLQSQSNNTVYIPIKGKEKNYTTELEGNEANLFTEDFFGEGKVNEFIWKQNKDSLLIHGMAGSGKSTATQKIEQFLWKMYEIQVDQSDAIPLVPIFISLPALRDPIYSAVWETLKSDNYRFGDRQVEEFKEAVESGKFRIIFIMDSYDEIKQQYLGLNINVSNKLSKWRNPKDKGRYPKVITTSRTELFNKKGYFTWFISESNDLKLFKEVRLIQFDASQINQYIYEYCQLEALKIITQFGLVQDLMEFKRLWGLNQIQIDKFVQKEFSKQAQSLIEQLWKPKQYMDCVATLQLEILLVTPFMMEIVLVVLPKIINGKKEINSIKDIFIQRYSQNELEALNAWQQIISNSQFIDEYQTIQTQAQMDQIVNKYFNTNQNYKSLQQALVLEPLTSFDFYMEFFENYSDRQIQKLKEQGECPEIKEELWEFAHQLANQMTFNNLSQVQFQQSGLVFKKTSKDWTDLFFDDDCPEGRFKKIFRKCIPLNQKNGTYSFNHKSIQEFLVSKWFISKLDNLESQDFFSQYNWDQEYLKGPIRFIADKLKHNKQSQQQLFKILLKTRDNSALIRAGSNSMLILYQSEYSFQNNQDLSQIHIKDINLAGINFFGSNLEKSCFENVNLSFSNLSKAKLTNCKWDPIKINERPTLYSPEDQETIDHMIFLNNSEYLLSVNYKKQIKEWNITEAKQVRTNYFDNLKIKLIVKSIKVISNNIALVDDDNIYIFDTINNQMIYIFEYSHLIQIDTLAFICDDTALILGGSELYRFNIPQTQQLNDPEVQGEQDSNTIISKNSKKNRSDKKHQEIQQSSESNKFKLLQEQIVMLADQKITSLKASLKYILASENQSYIWIYNHQENTFLVQEMQTNHNIIYSSSISIDGSMFATGGFNQIINLYLTDKLDSPKYLKGHTDKVTELEFFSSNKYLISGSLYDQSIRLWDIQTSIQLNHFQVDFKITQFAVQFNSMLLAVGTRDGIIQLYDMEQSGQMNVKIQGHSESIQCCDCSNDGVVLASGSNDKTIKLWNFSSGQQMGKNMKKHIPQTLGFTKDDQFLFSGDGNGLIIQWEVSSQVLLKEFQNFGDSILNLFAIDNNSIITRSADLTIKFWHFNQHTYQVFANCLDKQSSQFDYLDVVANCYKAKEFEFNQKNILNLNKQIITAILLTKDERFKVLGTNDGELIFIDTYNSKRQEKCFKKQILVIVQIDQEFVVSASEDKQIAISSFQSGVRTKQLQQTDNPINDIVISNDLIVSCDYSIMIQSKNLTAFPKYLQLKEPQKILTLCIQKNMLYSGTENGMLHTWDLDLHKQINQIQVSQWNITKLKYLPFKQQLLASSSDGNIYFIESNQIKLQFETGDPIQFMEISNDEQLILLGHESYLSLWDLQKQLKIDNFGYFKKIVAMFVRFDDCLALVSDQNSLIMVPLSLRRINTGIVSKNSSYVTCAIVESSQLITGNSKGLVSKWNLDEFTNENWQDEQQEIVKINQFEEFFAVGYKKGIKIINWNTKQTIYENEVQGLMGSLSFISNKIIVYSIEKTIYIVNLQSKEIKEINQHMKEINGIIANKNHFISFGFDKMIRVYENQSQSCKYIISIVQKLECDQTIIEQSAIKTASGFDLQQLFRQRGAH